MSYQSGDVVLLNFPFASGTGGRPRPAIVVQSDDLNSRIANTIVIQVTSNLSRINEPTQFLIDPSSAIGASSGLLSVSAAICGNIATVETGSVTRKIGFLDPLLIETLNRCLRLALDLG